MIRPTILSFFAGASALHLNHVHGGGVGASENASVFTVYDTHFLRIFFQWKGCAKKVFGDEAYYKLVAEFNLDHEPEGTESMTKGGASLLETEAYLTAQRKMDTPKIGKFIIEQMYQELLVQRPVFHIGADVFLLKNPLELTSHYWEADVIGAADCVHSDVNVCSWYLQEPFLSQHKSEDPLAAEGFMVNLDFVFIRSNPSTLSLVKKVVDSMDPSFDGGEQPIFMENLIKRGCVWKAVDGRTVPRGKDADTHLLHNTLHGVCEGEGDHAKITVVVLPVSVVLRSVGPITSDTVAIHPGGRMKDKSLAASLVSSHGYCPGPTFL